MDPSFPGHPQLVSSAKRTKPIEKTYVYIITVLIHEQLLSGKVVTGRATSLNDLNSKKEEC